MAPAIKGLKVAGGKFIIDTDGRIQKMDNQAVEVGKVAKFAAGGAVEFVDAAAAGDLSTHTGATAPHGSATSVGGKTIPSAGFEASGAGASAVASHDALATTHASATTIGGKSIPSAGFQPLDSAIQAHITGTGSPHSAAGVGAETSGAVSTHNGLTGPHSGATSIGGKSIPSAGIEPAGTGHTEATDHVATHAGVTASVHNFDSSGNAPPAAHAATLITSGALDGDRLPAMSTTKKGGVPATGTPSNKYLRDDATWTVVSASPPELATSNMLPAGNTTIAAGYATYVPDSFEIPATYYLEIASGAVMEIG